MKHHSQLARIRIAKLPALAPLILLAGTWHTEAASIDVNQTFDYTSTTAAATTAINWSELTWDNTPTWGAGVTAGIPNGSGTTSLARTYTVDVEGLTLKQLQLYNQDLTILQGGTITWDSGETGVQCDLGHNRHTMGNYAAGRIFTVSSDFILNSDLRVTNWVESQTNNRDTTYNSNTSGDGMLTLRIVPWGATNNCELFIGGTSANTHTGGTTLTMPAGNMNAQAAKSAAFGTGVLTLDGDGIVNLDLKGYSQTVAGLSSGGDGAHGLNNSVASLTTLTLKLADSTTTTYAAGITGDDLALVVDKAAASSGTGVQVLAGANTYTGATDVTAGTLLVNGSLDGTGAVSVAADATLGGTGSIAGDVTVDPNGTLSPGASVGTLSVASAAISGTLAIEIDTVGVAQVETATASGTATGDGNVDVTVTGDGITGSPVTLNVPVLNGDTQDVWAGKVRDALAADAAVTALYTVGGSGADIILTRITPTANDSTLNIALDYGDPDPGTDQSLISADTTAGAAPSNDLLAVTGALDISAATLDLSINGTLTAPAYVIATYGSLVPTSGPFATFPSLPAGYVYDYIYSGGTAIAIKKVGGANYSTWASANGISGEPFDGDFDGDGLSNGLEYAIAGLVPTTPDGSPGSFNGSLLSFTKRTEAVTNGDVSYAIETSQTLLPGSWTTVTPDTNNSTTISYTLPAGQGKIFARLVVTQGM